MCGIAGFSIKNFNENKKNHLIDCFKKLQVHRGPDYNSDWNDDQNYFFHHRLALIDESKNGNQPFYNDDYVLCYNGEIYNFLELKQSLPSVTFVSKSDTEVLFHYLINFGIEKTLQDIKGMFAFSFYSKKKKEIILARDRYGIKPLYFVNNKSVFAFASEVRTLAKALDLKPDSYKTMMSLNSTAEGSTTYTLFNDIETISPGTYLKVVDNFTISKHNYYRLSDDIDEKLYNELSKKPTKQVISDFESLLTKSVKEMLVSDSPMGSFVSGGIDSSILTAIAKPFSPNLSLFTADIVGKHSEYDDARLLADHLDLNLKKIDFEQADFLKYWIESTEHNCAPIIYFTNALPIARVASLARQNNVKAILSGEGSDEMFLGYSKLMAERYKSKLLFPQKILKSIYKLYPALDSYLFPSEFDNLHSFNVRLANGFKSEMLNEEGKSLFNFAPKSQQKHYVNSFEMMQKHLHALLHRNDRMGMISSIEVRFPFLHEDVVKFALNLPLEYKTRWTSKLHNKKHPFITDKWIVREISKRYLPSNLVSKSKKGLPIDGLSNLKIKKEFFKNGYIAENLKLTDTALDYLISNENPYFIGKLASVELFGMNYDYQESNADMQKKIDQYCFY